MASDDDLTQLTRHLSAKYDGTFSEDEVAAAVAQAREEVEAQSTIADFLPTFVQRRTADILRERAGERGIDLGRVKQIFFIDDKNIGRSQIAAAIANGRGDGLIRARSGGVAPGEELAPEIVELLRDRGHDTEALEVNPLTGKAALASDVVVTMGLTEQEKDELPVGGLRQVDWDDETSLKGLSRADLDQAWARIEEKVDELVRNLLEGDEREIDPEVDQEIRDTLADLHSGDRS